MTLSADARTWIEQELGGRIVAVEQQIRWRPHYFLTVERDGEEIPVLARCGRKLEEIRGTRMLTHFDIGHEAGVLAALRGRGLKIPEFLGFSPEHRMILMSRLDGTNSLADTPDEETRRSIMFEYYEELARLHKLDISSLNLVGIDIPRTPDDIAFKGKFQYAEADYLAVRDSLRPEPLLDLGIWWLHSNIPRSHPRVSLIQGDTGPGQFMFADGHLTGLIDWELAHIGDPMLDLGVARMRNMLYPTGPLREPIAHYEDASGTAIDWAALSFYTVESMLLTPLAMAKSIQQPTARIDSMLARYGWDVTLRRGLCDALAEALSLEIEPPELPEDRSSDSSSVADFLVDHLEVSCAPIARDETDRYQLDSALAVARSLQLESHIGQKLRDDDLDDMGSVLGRRPGDRDDGFARLRKLVSDAPEKNFLALVSLFSRIERRREHLWKPLMTAQSAGPFERLAPGVPR